MVTAEIINGLGLSLEYISYDEDADEDMNVAAVVATILCFRIFIWIE